MTVTNAAGSSAADEPAPACTGQNSRPSQPAAALHGNARQRKATQCNARQGKATQGDTLGQSVRAAGGGAVAESPH